MQQESATVRAQLHEVEDDALDDEQKRRLRAVRRGYRAQAATVKDNGWQIEVQFLDGSSVTVNAKLLKLRAKELVASNE
ncbi:MAG: hypothetical protein KDD69_00705 [Bdellovibrionales bacterium]|nr:hypothetical protein [Bdellovibrionales bacterium]